MKSIQSNPHDHGAEGDQRIRTAVCSLGADQVYDVQPNWGADASTPLSAHACNCVGCCRKCGTCRTWHGHTADYCALIQRQAAERAAHIERGAVVS